MTGEADHLRKYAAILALSIGLGALFAQVSHAPSPALAITGGVALAILTAGLGWLLKRPVAAGGIMILVSAPMWLQRIPLAGRIGLPGMLLTLAAATGLWSSRARAGELTPADGFFGFGVLVWTSLILSLSLLMGPPVFLAANLPLLLAAYLLTPPTELFIVIMILVRHRMFRPFLKANYCQQRAWPRFAAVGAGVGLLMSTAVGLLVALESKVGHIAIRSNNPFVYAPSLNVHPGVLVLMAVAVVIMAPIAEEALFRGILFGSLRPVWSFGWANIVAAVVFGAAHMDATLFIPLAIAGMILNGVYAKTRSLIPSTIAHASLNALAVLTAVFAVR